MFLVLGLLSPAYGYDEKVHQLLTERALAELVGEAPAGEADGAQLDALLALIDAWARQSSHAAEWTARYPLPEDFDRWEFKELCFLNPDRQLYGVDRFDRETTTLALLAISSRRPDDDYRNRDRLAHTAEREPVADVPDDPVILNMGKLGQLSSQAHAHYGLDQLTFSADPEVLKSDPPRFAVGVGWPDGPVLTFAPELAQTHVDIATLAFLDGHDALGDAWFGQGLHYVEDVSNPVHTVQVGLYAFFQDAFFERMFVSARTGGGYFGELPTLGSIGIGILTNHHTIGEALARKRLLAGDEALTAALTQDDAALAAKLPQTATGDFVLAATRTLVHETCPDGAPLYAATRAVVDPRYRKLGAKFDDATEDPESTLRPGVKPAEMEPFYTIQARSFSRGGTTVRALWRLESQRLADARTSSESLAAARDETLERFVSRSLKLRGEADARLAEYRAKPPAAAGPPPPMPGMFVAEVLGSAAAGFGLSRGLRRVLRRKA